MLGAASTPERRAVMEPSIKHALLYCRSLFFQTTDAVFFFVSSFTLQCSNSRE